MKSVLCIYLAALATALFPGCDLIINEGLYHGIIYDKKVRLGECYYSAGAPSGFTAVIRTQVEFDSALVLIFPFPDCDTPRVDFSKYTLLVQSVPASGCCRPDWDVTFHRDDSTGRVTFTVDVTEYGYCDLFIPHLEWYVSPHIPNSYDVTFRKSYRIVEHSGECPPDEPEGNLIANGSFEDGGRPTLGGWEPNTTDTAFINFSNDVPPDGGLYSIRLRNEWTFPGTISYRVLPADGEHRYRLSAWAKTVRTDGLFAGGEIALITVKDGIDSLRESMHFTDSTWTYGQFDETISSDMADSVIIRLRGNIDQWSTGYILFDLCSFEIIR